jgi:hypothetical protein
MGEKQLQPHRLHLQQRRELFSLPVEPHSSSGLYPCAFEGFVHLNQSGLHEMEQSSQEEWRRAGFSSQVCTNHTNLKCSNRLASSFVISSISLSDCERAEFVSVPDSELDFPLKSSSSAMSEGSSTWREEKKLPSSTETALVLAVRFRRRRRELGISSSPSAWRASSMRLVFLERLPRPMTSWKPSASTDASISILIYS